MLQLSSVVSRVRRALRRQRSRYQLEPPDLRRWSDFMNPFPQVSPGGYRRYYETHGWPEPKPLPADYLVSTPRRLSQRRRHHRHPSPSPSPVTAPASSQVPFPPTPSPSPSTSPCRDTEKPKRTLSTIPESNSSSSPSLSTARMPTLSNTSSLRRRRRQPLRTSSVERDFPSRAPTIASTADPDAESSSSSGSSQSDSSPSPHPYSVDTPPTTVEGLDEDLAVPVSAQEGEGYYDGDETDPYDRPDSRSTYCTARSDLGED